MLQILKKKKILFALGVLVAALISVSVFAATTATGTVPVTPGSTASDGGVGDVAYLADPFVLIQGSAQKISGVELCKIDLGSPTIRNDIRVHVLLRDPQNMGKVLNNPNSWIEIQVAYVVSSGQDFVLNDSTKVKVAQLRESVDNNITEENGSVILLPLMGVDSIDTDTYYVLGSIMVPGGAPPGQQTQLATLEFFCNVKR